MKSPTPNEWQEILTGEILLLNLISRAVYFYPDDKQRGWLESLAAEDVFSEAPFASDHDDTKTGLQFLQKWAEKGLTREVFEDMQVDYTRLFLGPDKVIAAPWESVYFSEERLTFQEQTLGVRSWYHRFGLEAEKIHQEPDDHIGLELLFLSHLATLGIQALNEKDEVRFKENLEAQRGFINDHLGTWALDWCELVEENARTNFYKGMACLTRGALFALSDVLDIKLAKDTEK